MVDADLLNDTPDAIQFALPSRLDTAAAPGLVSDLMAYEGRDICLDFKDVKLLGTLCLQVLLNVSYHWKLAGHSVSIKNVMPCVNAAIADFGTSPEALMTGDSA